MVVLVAGSRNWADEDVIRERLVHLLAVCPKDVKPEVITGGADGADAIARSIALKLGCTITTYPPRYDTYGKKAPHIRNDEMLDRADMVLVFWDELSKGTESVISKARKRGLYVEVCTPLIEGREF